MQIFQLNICEHSSSQISYKSQKILEQNKIKFEISNSGKSILLKDQNVIFTDINKLYTIVDLLLKSNHDLVLTHEENQLVIKSKYYTKLLIEHDIVLDVYNDLDEENVQILSEILKSMSVSFKYNENFIFTIYAQKCTLEFEKINEIIRHINYGSHADAELTMYDGEKYAITQRQGYQKYLK